MEFILCDTELNTLGVKVSTGFDILHEKCRAEDGFGKDRTSDTYSLLWRIHPCLSFPFLDVFPQDSNPGLGLKDPKKDRDDHIIIS